MNQMGKPQGGLLVKNTVLNVLGSVLPMLVGIVTIPYVVRGLGVERFGVLSLAWVILGYFNLFDFGLGRATTKFVAEAVGAGKMYRLPALVWTSFAFQLVLGTLGGITLAALTPFGVERILKIPTVLAVESETMFYVLSMAIPVSIGSVCFRGVLEAAERFDLVNAVKVPLNASVFLMPAVALMLGFSLPGIALLLLATQLAGAVSYLVLCFRVFPVLKQGLSIDHAILRPLLTYGGWVTGYSLIIPVVMYLDRFLIGILLSLGMVAYYTVPYDAVSQTRVLPSSLSRSLFPAFSALGTAHKEDVVELCARSLKYLLMAMGPLTLAFVLFAGDILRLWLGQDFAANSTLVFQLLAIAFFLNSLAWPPTTALLGLGRPDLVTKLFLLLLLLHAGLAWFLIQEMGLAGAALAVVVREGLHVILFFFAFWKTISLSFSTFAQKGLLRAAMTTGTLVVTMAFLVSTQSYSVLFQIVTMVGLSLVFLLVILRYVLDAGELAELQAGFLQVLRRAKGSK